VKQFGLPQHLVCDNELSIQEGCFADFAKTYGIIMHRTLAYSPQANGNAEQSVKAFKQCARAMAMATNTAHCWDTLLWKITNSLNSLVNSATKHSAQTLMYGHRNLNRMNEAIALTNNPGLAEALIPDQVERDHILTMFREINNVRDEQRAKNMSYMNARRIPPDLKPGDVVLHKRLAKTTAPGVPAALQKKYFGPYLLWQKYKNGLACKLVHMATGKIVLTSADFVKPWFHQLWSFILPPEWDKYLKTLLPVNKHHLVDENPSKLAPSKPLGDRVLTRAAARKLLEPG
jgi:hypothetical protein